MSKPRRKWRLTATFREIGGMGCPDPGRSGRRARAAARAAALAGLSAGFAFARLYEQDQRAGLAAARLGGPVDGGRPAGASASTSIACRWPTCRSTGADPVIGDRAYGRDARPGRGTGRRPCRRAARPRGVLPVVKHLPGHGRATADSHLTTAGGRNRSRDPGSDRFCGLSAPCRPAARHDRTCCVQRHRCGRAGHHIGDNGRMT